MESVKVIGRIMKVEDRSVRMPLPTDWSRGQSAASAPPASLRIWAGRMSDPGPTAEYDRELAAQSTMATPREIM